MKREDLRKVKFHKIDESRKEYQREGYFHKWGTHSDGEMIEEYAIIEDLEGHIIETFPSYVKFES